MNRKTYRSVLAVAFSTLVFSTLAFLTSCSSNSKTTPTVAIAATSGGGQSATVGAAFANPLVATVTTGGTPTANVTVTFTAPALTDGAFANTTVTDMETTNSSGVATSTVFTAGTAAGTYNVVASATGATSVNFSLTNTAGTPTTLTATSGSGQSAQAGAAFANPLVATITDGDGNGVPGISVTFTAPASGASGTFADGGTPAATDPETTDANGNATSTAFTANSTVGGPYNVVASSTGLTSVNFALTNIPVVVVTSNTYVFYLSGADSLPAGTGYNFYALAGAVTIDSSGNVLGGEQDYNDAFGATGVDDAIQAANGALVVDGTGQGTLTLTTLDTNVGVNGVETFNIQFVNSNHALIMQYDGSATSSGSLDLQTIPSSMDGNYAYAFSGVDKNNNTTALGGVFTITGLAISGVTDENDAGTVATNQPFTGNLTAPDTLGRGTLSITGSGSTIAYYVVGAEVIRVIDVDTNKSNTGSAYGQGSGSFSNASLGSSVLAVAGNSWVSGIAALGQFSTNTTAATFSGVGDDNDLINGLSTTGTAISGTYSIAANGYGSLTVTNGGFAGDISVLGIYMTDPALNLSDPNNPSGGGGALVLDLDDGSSTAPPQPGMIGVLVPQTDVTVTDFTGTYAAGWQDFNDFIAGTCNECEFDFIGLTSVGASNALNGTGQASDPFLTLSSTAAISGIPFSGTPAPDGSNPGRYSMTSGTASVFNWFGGTLDLDIFQANAGQLFWLNWDGNTVFLGPIEFQDISGGIPAARKPAAKNQAKATRKP